MKQTLASFAAALALMLPIYIGIAHFGFVEDWFISGAGWRAFDPLFRLCNAIGIRGNGRILTATMLCISFVIAFVAVSILLMLLHKLRLATTRKKESSS